VKVVPRYNLLPGTEITLLNRPMVVTGRSAEGYKVTGLEDGTASVISFAKLIEYLKLPGAKLDTSLPETGGRLKQRLGGYSTAEALSDEQRELARFHHAICRGLLEYRSKVREETGNPDFQLSNRIADRHECRSYVAAVAGAILGHRVRLNPRQGGKSKDLFLYRGRTLMDYFRIFEDLQPDESPLDALVPLHHRRGNRVRRLSIKLLDMMTEAWEQIGLDLKGPSVANVHKYLETKIREENKIRARNEMPLLVVPAARTLRLHLDSLVTPTEYLVATKGPRDTRNKRGRGSTDIRALMVGELCGMDECKMSMVASAKDAGFWETLSVDEKAAYEAADREIRKRLHIVVMLDVASRMPLAWIITENPNAEATLALLRMATRDKTREKIRYGCKGEPAEAVGLMHVRNDNGPGLRNNDVIGALLGIGSINSIGRAYASTDRAHDERFFGTLESDFFKLMPGYTGRRPGELPGYDSVKNGVIDVDLLYGMVTRYFIDEYPSQRHYGVGMGGRRPYEVYKEINATRGHIRPVDPNIRRIHLGWEVEATPTDEGVRVFHGIWFNSDTLQKERENPRSWGKKVQVYVDPDNLNRATVVLPGHPELIEVDLQITAFADMTLPEVLQLMAELRREDPSVTEFHEDQVMHARRRRYDEINGINVEKKLKRSYSTLEECQTMGRAVFSGARVIPAARLSGTTHPDEITMLTPAEGVFKLGEDSLIDGTAIPLADEQPAHAAPAEGPDDPPLSITGSAPDDLTSVPAHGPRGAKSSTKQGRLVRPKNLKDLDG
jgi:hypothetical protein